MKKILIFTFIVLLTSCEKEVTVTEASDKLQTLKIDNIKDFIPLSQSSKTKVGFYNEKGDEILFDFIMEEEIKEKKLGSESYFAEQISGSYINESINDYSLYFEGSGNYTKKNEHNLFVSSGINQFVEDGVTALSLDENGTPIFAIFYDNIQLLDKEFEAVYSNRIDPSATSFSVIYYNSIYGVIGFKDRENDLYVFKEFVD